MCTQDSSTCWIPEQGVQGGYTELNAQSFVSRIADSDQGTGSTGYREVFDKAQAVRTE